ncbi:MAG: hypothetical protein QCH31_09925 [Methanolobus sp.]|nr:hypothetical protein [Methanolobus sp.]
MTSKNIKNLKGKYHLVCKKGGHIVGWKLSRRTQQRFRRFRVWKEANLSEVAFKTGVCEMKNEKDSLPQRTLKNPCADDHNSIRVRDLVTRIYLPIL